MTAKQNFTTEEWAKLIESTMLASVAITAAEPSGLWGMIQEGFANASGVVAGASSESALVKEIVEELKTSAGRTIAQDALKQHVKGAKAAEIAGISIAAIADVAKIVDAKGGADAVTFKRWIYANAEKVANAASEGGFLGFGGEKVSEKERATLAQLSAALNLA